MVPYCGGQRRSVRCGLPFQVVIEKHASEGFFGRDPVEVLLRLFRACVPGSRHAFVNSYSPARLLHQNEYVLEKAFVYGVVALSKWMGKETFPQGIFGQWPPTPPSDLVPPLKCPVVDVTDDVPPHLRVGAPAGSSTDRVSV